MRLPNWKFKGTETERLPEVPPDKGENSWPDMFANLQSAYAELTNAQFELERRTTEIAETRDLVQQIISSMSDALFLTDRAGRVIRANPAAATLLGCTEETILGRPLSVVCNNEELPATPWKLVEMAQGQRTVSVDTEIHPPQAEPIPVNFSLTLMHDKQEKITGVLAVARDTREQRHLIDSLVHARTRFQELLEFAPDAIVLANQEGTIMLVNSQTERLFGYSREGLLGQSVEILVPERYRQNAGDFTANGEAATQEHYQEFPSELELSNESRNALMVRNADENAQQLEFYVVDAHGREFLTEITQRPIVTEEGVLLMSVIRDISDRKRIEQELQNSEARHRALAETAQDVIVTMDELRMIQFINSAVERVFGYKAEELIGQSINVLLPEYDTGEQALARFGTGQLRRALPHQEMLGRRKDGTSVQLDIANSQFRQEGRLLYTAFIRDISERRRIEQKLSESEARYRNVAETAAEVIVTVDAQMVIQFANPAAARVFGYAPPELVGQSLELLVPPRSGEGAPSLKSYLQREERPAHWSSIELLGQHRDGHELQIDLSFSEFERDGATFFTGIIRDITDRKRMEQQLLESEERYRNVALTAAEAILTVNADDVIKFANPAVTRVFGYDPQHLLGRKVNELMPDYDQHIHKPASATGTTERGYDWKGVELRGKHRDGHEIALEVSFKEFTRDGKKLRTGIIRDITERKQAEERVREATAVQRAILDFASYAIITTRPDGVINTFNPAAERLLGYSAEEMIGQQTPLVLFDAEELAQRAAELTAELDVLEPGTEPHPTSGFEVLVAKARQHQPNESEWTFIRQDSTRLPVNLSVSALRDANGEITGFLAIASDITERKRAQERFARQTALRLALSNVLASSDVSLQVVLQRAAETIADQLKASLARLWLLEAKGQQLLLQASAGALELTVDEQVTLGHGRIGQVGSQRAPRLYNATPQAREQAERESALLELDEEVAAASEQDWSEQEGLLGFAGYPLLSGGRLLGVLAIYARQPLDEDALNALGAAADTIVLNLERKRAEEERAQLQAREAERIHHQAALRVEVSSALNQLDITLPQMLQSCAQAVVNHVDAALARIWLLDSAGEKLVLQASAGLYTDLQGAQQFITLGQGKIGTLAQQRKAELTNAVTHDALLANEDWLTREGVVAFAGYPLLSQGRLLGVLAMFAKQPLEREALNALAAVADLIVLGVERRKAEDARAALLETEQEARREAEEASRLKDDFLAMISHELRAPLTAILGWAQMLRSGTLDRTAAERALQTIERNSKTQAHLVGDLLDASRIATGKLRLDKQPIELIQLIDAVIDAVRPTVEAKSLRMQIVMEPWVGPFEGDPERMRQIVWNLLSNAVKFTPPGGLIEVRLEKMENKALLIVSDTGQGIEPEFLPHIFDRFRQADSSTMRAHGGLGLGLAIVKSLVEMHGGAIYAYSQGKDKGSDFMVTLPLTVPNADETAKELWGTHDAPRQLRGAGSLRGARVLIVDDERDTREILAVMIGRFGAEVRLAGTAAEGFRILQDWRPDLLVSDIGMPGEDGYALIGKVRALSPEAGGQTPAVALTAFASSQDRQKALTCGFQLHLAKPIEPVELARMVARALGRSEAGIEL